MKLGTISNQAAQIVVAVAALGSTAGLVATGHVSGQDFLLVLVSVLTGHFALQANGTSVVLPTTTTTSPVAAAAVSSPVGTHVSTPTPVSEPVKAAQV